MPRISEFFGITIQIFDVQKHQLPRFHARYQGAEAVFALDGRLLEGVLSPRACRLIEEWCRERSTELERAWTCAYTGKEIPWVLPLQ